MAAREFSVPSIMEQHKSYFEQNGMKSTKLIRKWFDEKWESLGMEKALSSDGQIPGVLKKWGWTNSNQSESVKSKSETVITVLSFSNEFKDAMQHLHIVGYVPFQPGYLSVETVDGNSVTVNKQTRNWLAKELFSEPLNSTFMFAVRNCKESDWKLAGLETPAMRQARQDREKIESDKIQSAISLLEGKGYKLVKQESSSLFAEFQASEQYKLAELCTMASFQALENFRNETCESARMARINAYLVKRAKIEFAVSQSNQAHAVAAMQADDAKEKIVAAIKERDEALAREKALEERLARLEALLTANPEPTKSAKPQGKRINNTQANASA